MLLPAFPMAACELCRVSALPILASLRLASSKRAVLGLPTRADSAIPFWLVRCSTCTDRCCYRGVNNRASAHNPSNDTWRTSRSYIDPECERGRERESREVCWTGRRRLDLRSRVVAVRDLESNLSLYFQNSLRERDFNSDRPGNCNK
jgi:hypothetical protein